MRIGLGGCGALGSWIAMFLPIESDISLALYDFDRVDKNNVITGTSAYTKQHLGTLKANALAGMLWNKFEIGVAVINNAEIVRSDQFKYPDLIVDCFDNKEARLNTIGAAKNVLHVGVSPQLIGSVVWDEQYKLPESDNTAEHICTHQVGRNIILATALIASRSIQDFLADGSKRNYIVNDRMELL